MPDVTRKNHPDLPVPGGTFHHSVRVGNLLFISGFTAGNSDSINSGLGAQAETVYQRIQAVLQAEGGSMRNVVKLTVFVTDMSELPDYRKVAQRYLEPAHYPASTLVQISRLVEPNAKIEIEAVAALD